MHVKVPFPTIPLPDANRTKRILKFYKKRRQENLTPTLDERYQSLI
jgi:hypothetical protein